MTRWIIPAPVWRDGNCYLGGIFVGTVLSIGETTTATFLLQGEVRCHFKRATGSRDQCQGKAWVEAEAMRAFGAEVADE